MPQQTGLAYNPDIAHADLMASAIHPQGRFDSRSGYSMRARYAALKRNVYWRQFGYPNLKRAWATRRAKYEARKAAEAAEFARTHNAVVLVSAHFPDFFRDYPHDIRVYVVQQLVERYGDEAGSGDADWAAIVTDLIDAAVMLHNAGEL